MARTLLAATLTTAAWATLTAQDSYVAGVFVQSSGAPLELIAYADRTRFGQMRMSYGTLEDIPALASPTRILVNVPTWKPVSVWLSTRSIFKDEFAERRVVPFAVRQLNVAALELRIADFEDPARAARLLRGVRASEANPAYLFITLDNGSVTRDYIVEVAPPPPGR